MTPRNILAMTILPIVTTSMATAAVTIGPASSYSQPKEPLTTDRVTSDSTALRRLSGPVYKYNDELTICLCNNETICQDNIPPDDVDKINLCFHMTAGRGSNPIAASGSNSSSLPSMDVLVDLTFEVFGRPTTEHYRQDIVDNQTIVQEETTTVEYGSQYCMVRTGLSFNSTQYQPEVLIARGSAILQFLGQEEAEEVSFAKILNLQDELTDMPTTTATGRTKTKSFAIQTQDGERQKESTSSGYAMVTGVVVLIPGLWGLAMYTYRRMYAKTLSDDDEEDIFAGSIVYNDGKHVTSTDDDEHDGYYDRDITIMNMEDAIAAVDRKFGLEEEEKEEWETISCN